MTYGRVMVGLWMSTPEEADIMLRALEERLRNTLPNDPDRKRLEEWRRQALNMSHRAQSEDWVGWEAGHEAE